MVFSDWYCGQGTGNYYGMIAKPINTCDGSVGQSLAHCQNPQWNPLNLVINPILAVMEYFSQGQI